MKKFGIIVLVGCLMGAGYATIKIVYPSYTFRFRYTVEVEVDGETKLGSSVLEVRVQKQPAFSSPISVGMRGEAVYVDLGSRGHVIALLGFGPDGSHDRLAELTVNRLGLNFEDESLRQLPKLRGQAAFIGTDRPTFITFVDPGDPKSARVVKPEDFEKQFGSGVHLRSVGITMTSDPVTNGILSKLPWWNAPGRPAADAHSAWIVGTAGGSSVEPERLFVKN